MPDVTRDCDTVPPQLALLPPTPLHAPTTCLDGSAASNPSLYPSIPLLHHDQLITNFLFCIPPVPTRIRSLLRAHPRSLLPINKLDPIMENVTCHLNLRCSSIERLSPCHTCPLPLTLVRLRPDRRQVNLVPARATSVAVMHGLGFFQMLSYLATGTASWGLLYMLHGSIGLLQSGDR